MTVCFSGHRSFSGDDGGRLAAAVEAAYADGYRTFVSGMAAGFDLAAAECVLLFREALRAARAPEAAGISGTSGTSGTSGDGVKLVCAVPFGGQARDFSPEDRQRWEAIAAAADSVEVLAERYSHGVFYRRNEWMVGRSGRLICWYDARGISWSGASSGTRHTVRTALAAGLEIVNIFRPANTLF